MEGRKGKVCLDKRRNREREGWIEAMNKREKEEKEGWKDEER